MSTSESIALRLDIRKTGACKRNRDKMHTHGQVGSLSNTGVPESSTTIKRKKININRSVHANYLNTYKRSQTQVSIL